MEARFSLPTSGRTLAFMAAVTCLVSYGAAAVPLSLRSDAIFARGINLPSASFNDKHLPGMYGTDYIYPTANDLDYYASKGFSVVRLTYRWERLQRSLFGNLDRRRCAEAQHAGDPVTAQLWPLPSCRRGDADRHSCCTDRRVRRFLVQSGSGIRPETPLSIPLV